MIRMVEIIEMMQEKRDDKGKQMEEEERERDEKIKYMV